MTKIVKESSDMEINRAEYRSQKSEVKIQKTDNKSKKVKLINLGLLRIGILMICICLPSCNPQRPKMYDKSTLITYSQLTLLYEKEKMVNKQTDSTYVAKVKDFFASKGLKQDEFKKRIEAISQNDEDWKVFIQDVSMAMDSLKRVEGVK